MLPPLDIVGAGLRLTTEALAAELARSLSDYADQGVFAAGSSKVRQAPMPGNSTPSWSAQEWRLAAAAAAAHGVAPLLARICQWQHADWQQFLASQRQHVADRHQRLSTLLARIDSQARAAGLALVALKGSALHALGIYVGGDRPMADIDLLVAEEEVERATTLLHEVGYAEAYAQWKHRVFKPIEDDSPAGLTLGEHRDTPINIELHTRIQERLPISTIDITRHIYPQHPRPGLNPYPSNGALMSHLLLHAAGNVCNCNARLMQLHDIALLASRMTDEDWRTALNHDGRPAWWSLPPLRLTARYYVNAIPATLFVQTEAGCPALLRALARDWTLTQVSASRLWLQAFPGIEWSRSVSEAARYIKRRVRPPQESIRERADMIRTQAWLRGQSWVTAPQRRRWLTWLTRPVPRTDTLYAVRAAFESPSFAA